jgi:ligand-binding sensor domain-containing protein
MRGNRIESLVEDGAGNVWVGTYPPFDAENGRHGYAGLHRYDGERWRHLEPGPRAAWNREEYFTLASESTNELLVLAGGENIAVATNGGLSIYHDGDYRSWSGRHPGLASGFIHSLSQDVDGRLWLTHAYWGPGLSWRSAGLFRHLDSRDGLFADRLERVASDGEGRVWILATSGRVGVYRRSSF